MVIVAVILILGALASGLWGVYNIWHRPMASMAAIAAAFVLIGLGIGLLHAIGAEGF